MYRGSCYVVNVLIVYAHPNPSSFNAAIFNHVQKDYRKQIIQLRCLIYTKNNLIQSSYLMKRRKDVI